MYLIIMDAMVIAPRLFPSMINYDYVLIAHAYPQTHCEVDTLGCGVGVDGSNERKLTRNQKRKHDEINHVQKTFAEMDPLAKKGVNGCKKAPKLAPI